MATSATGFLTAEPTPEVARRTWPRWLALGAAMIAVAVTALLWDAAGARLLLGAIGAFLAVRGAVVLRGARTGGLGEDVSDDVAGRATRFGGVVTGVGALALVAALVSASLAERVLLVAVPLLLLVAAWALLGRGGGARRGGQALGVWALLVIGLLVAAGVTGGVDRAAGVVTVVTAVAVAVLGVPMLLAAANLRAVAARPEPPRAGGCGGCACGAGGCGS